jgi:prepilin-type processing-associated H-X9-DG protein
MLRTTSLRALSILAAAALSAAIFLPSAADAAGRPHPGGANFAMLDGSVRFDGYPNFQGGVVVATGDVSGVSGRITGVVVDPSDPATATTINGNLQIADLTSVAIDPMGPGSTEETWTVIVVTDHGATAADVPDRSTDLVIDPFNR